MQINLQVTGATEDKKKLARIDREITQCFESPTWWTDLLIRVKRIYNF